jgi:hypothetical protein
MVAANPVRVRPRVTPPKLTSSATRRFQAMIMMRAADPRLRGRSLKIAIARYPRRMMSKASELPPAEARHKPWGYVSLQGVFSPVHRLQGRSKPGSSGELRCSTLGSLSFSRPPIRRNRSLRFQRARSTSPAVDTRSLETSAERRSDIRGVLQQINRGPAFPAN